MDTQQIRLVETRHCVGVVMQPPFSLDGIGEVDVRWPASRPIEHVAGLLPAADEEVG